MVFLTLRAPLTMPIFMTVNLIVYKLEIVNVLQVAFVWNGAVGRCGQGATRRIGC